MLNPIMPFLLSALVVSCLGAEPDNLIPQLEPLRPFVGHTWKGHFPRSTPDKPVFDIARWERALNGQAVKITHSVNNGAYGGETTITWNSQEQKVQYYYFTTAGFMTKGTMKFEQGKVLCEEEVIPALNGLTKIKAVMQLVDGKKMHVKSEHWKDGAWTPGHEITYEQAPGAQVLFK